MQSLSTVVLTWQTIKTKIVAFTALVLGGLLLSAACLAETRVYLATMAPGELYFERFGHNAIVVHDSLAPASQNSVAFNFGYFDFNGKNFLSNFLLGRMAYLGVALNAEADLQNYIQNGRAVWLQELALNPAQQTKLIARLRAETTAPNDVYRYDYFRANCSTKIRDALDYALDGALQTAVRGRSHGYTFRSLGLSHAAEPLWLYLGIHAGLGPSTDRPLDVYAESFIPAALQQAVATVQLTAPDGSRYPLVRSKQSYGPAGGNDLSGNSMPALPGWRWYFSVAGLLLAIIIATGFRFRRHHLPRRFSAVIAALTALSFGTSGLLLLFLMLFTDHQDSYFNLNFALFSPLWLLCLPALLAGFRERASTPNTFYRRTANLALTIAAIGIAVKVFPAVKQQNIEWVLFSAPVILALHFASTRRKEAVGDSMPLSELA
jgi:hypothetical protein